MTGEAAFITHFSVFSLVSIYAILFCTQYTQHIHLVRSSNVGDVIINNDIFLVFCISQAPQAGSYPRSMSPYRKSLFSLSMDGAGVPGKQKKGTLWPVDYDNNGETCQNRVPKGNPPISWIHGLPSAAV